MRQRLMGRSCADHVLGRQARRYAPEQIRSAVASLRPPQNVVSSAVLMPFGCPGPQPEGLPRPLMHQLQIGAYCPKASLCEGCEPLAPFISEMAGA